MLHVSFRINDYYGNALPDRIGYVLRLCVNVGYFYDRIVNIGYPRRKIKAVVLNVIGIQKRKPPSAVNSGRERNVRKIKICSNSVIIGYKREICFGIHDSRRGNVSYAAVSLGAKPPVACCCAGCIGICSERGCTRVACNVICHVGGRRSKKNSRGHIFCPLFSKSRCVFALSACIREKNCLFRVGKV